MRSAFVYFSALLAAVLIAAEAKGARIEPNLATAIDAASPEAWISALIAPRSAAALPQLEASFATRVVSRAERHRSVISLLRAEASASQASLLARIAELEATGEVRGHTAYWLANVIAIEARPAALRELAARGDVDVIESNFRPVLIEPLTLAPAEEANARSEREHRRAVGDQVEPGIRAINADRVWHDLGVTGQGTLIANIDTGVDASHPALRERWRGLHADPDACWRDYIGVTSTPVDQDRHGTHVMGTMTGLIAEDTIGVAWGAEWIAANPLLRRSGPSLDNAILDAFQWLVDPDGDVGTVDDVPDVVQNSWGVEPSEGHGYTWCDSRWWEVIDHCEAAGVVVTFSAGNSGPTAMTIVSPASRADSPTNCFAVGAIDAGNTEFPYPIANFSSRGPSRCDALSTKPEVVAPGVGVYSSTPNNRYEWLSGTSMAGPHVAGVVALIREIDPDISPEAVKLLLMQTARDLSGGGEDNTFGHGVVDAYAAVVAAGANFGRVDGTVRFAGGGVVQGALVTLGAQSFRTGADGRFASFTRAGEYVVEAYHPELSQSSSDPFEVAVGGRVAVTIELQDRAIPALSPLEVEEALGTPGDSLQVRLAARDYSPIPSVELRYRAPGAAWQTRRMALDSLRVYSAWIPEQSIGRRLELEVAARDLWGNEAIAPGGGDPLAFTVRAEVLRDDARVDQGWTFGSIDDSDAGTWIRMIPFGSSYQGRELEPSHDRGGDGYCFVTGKGKPKVDPELADVDAGCVTLMSPRFDLSLARSAVLSYWRWLALARFPDDGRLRVEASSDDGASWVLLEEISEDASSWQRHSFALDSYLRLSDAMRVRFLACDDGEDSIVEAAVDDIAIETLPRALQGNVIADALELFPNPFRGRTFVHLSLSSESPARIEIFDSTGRRVRRLLEETLPAGEHLLRWNGEDDQGRVLPSGVYLARVSVDGRETTRRALRIK